MSPLVQPQPSGQCPGRIRYQHPSPGASQRRYHTELALANRQTASPVWPSSYIGEIVQMLEDEEVTDVPGLGVPLLCHQPALLHDPGLAPALQGEVHCGVLHEAIRVNQGLCVLIVVGADGDMVGSVRTICRQTKACDRPRGGAFTMGVSRVAPVGKEVQAWWS